jgi:hypothetical protein
MATKTSVLMLGGSLTSCRLVFSRTPRRAMYHRRVAASCHDGSIQFRGNLSRRNAEVSRSHQAMIVDTHVDVVSHLMDA